ncbi:MAG: hypothetical protein VZQ47_04635 [Treponema sp.]|nr:hypothetical protein [Treponema sp.]MEE3434821.1 hypothetical protein [Treponema sp.]
MLKKSIRKMFGLLVLYAAIIVGIFVLQFRSDSIIRKNIRALRVTLAELNDGKGGSALKNSFQVSFNGISFSADEKKPVLYTSSSGHDVPVTLVSYSQPDKLSYALDFTKGVRLTFSLSDDSDSASLWVAAEMPSDASSVKVNYAPYSGFSVSDLKSKSAIFTGKIDSYSLIAPSLSDGKIQFQKNSKSAHYSMMKKQSDFSLDRVGDLAFASRNIYDQTISSLSKEIVNKFISASQTEANFAMTVNEQSVVSFVAAMAEAGRYNEALNSVPEAFIKGNRRTYQSAPFFGSMADLLPTLTMQIENLNNMILRAVQERNLDIWTVDNLAAYMYTQGNRGNVALLAAIPASMTELNLTVGQAAGILRSWAYFAEQDSSLAKPLEPVLELCAQRIVKACSLDGEKVLLIENDAPISVLSAATAGDALAFYGKATGQGAIENCGYLIVNSYAGDTAALDLRATAELYPVLVHGNNFYPHYLLLKTMEGENVWAWTIATNIQYYRDENLTISLNIDFPVGLSHYMFVRGITPFLRIQIYNMDFRTDPRFEIYNSSGYIYRSAAQSLLLKSRHRDQHEVVRLYYRDVVEDYEEEEAAE